MGKNLLLKISSIIIALVMIFGLSAAPGSINGRMITEAHASSKTITVTRGEQFAVKGRYIYYTRNMSGTRTGIVRYDTKTKQKKTIVPYKYKGEWTNGFSNLTIKGKYIYAVWDHYYGTDNAEPYIYRFDLKGKNRKRLACGYNFAMKGNKIYFTKCKMKNYGDNYISPVEKGLYSMSLAGKKMKKVKGVVLKESDYMLDYSCDSVRINHTNFAFTDDPGPYDYHTYTSLKKITESAKKTIYACKKQEEIYSAEIHGKWVMLNVYNKKSFKIKLILMDINGKNRKTLKTWRAGE